MSSTDGAEVRFRRAGPDDVAGVVGLVESAYRGDASRAGWTTEADLLEGQRTDEREVGAIVAAPDAQLLLAELTGSGPAGASLVGCCHLEGRPGGVAYLGMFAVHPACQGQGLGRRIEAEAERVARDELGAERLEMTVIRQRADIIAWYTRLGYAPTGETRPFPYGDERFGRPTRSDLEFVVLSRDLGGGSTPDR